MLAASSKGIALITGASTGIGEVYADLCLPRTPYSARAGIVPHENPGAASESSSRSVRPGNEVAELAGEREWKRR